MTPFARPLSLLVAAAALLAAPSAAFAEDAEATALEARNGKALRYSLKTVAPTNVIDTGGAAILVDAPIATVRKIVMQYDGYARLIKPFEQSRVLSKRNGAADVYLKVPVAHGAVSIWAVAKMTGPIKDGDGEKIVGTYTNKGNVDDFRAVWRLRAVDANRTIVKLEVLVDPQMPFPASMVTPELKYAADKAVTAMRDAAHKQVASASSAPPPPPAAPAAPTQEKAPPPPQKPGVANR